MPRLGDDVPDDALPDPDDRPPGPLPHRLDRVWVHPSELAPAAPGPRATIAARRRSRRAVAALAGTAVLLAAGVAVAGGVLESDEPRVDTTTVPTARFALDVREASAGAGVVAVVVTRAGATRRGSGVCLRHAGDVLTSHDLVAGVSEVHVIDADGRTLAATVVGRDPASGLALLTVDAPLTAARLADEPLTVGAPVTLVGATPPGNETAWTRAGVVASTEALVAETGGPTMATLIETDARATPSVGGGALVTDDGAVAGVVLAPVNGRGAVAVPIADATAVADQLRERGWAAHGWLGIEGTDGDDEVAVRTVVRGGPAADAGLRPGDRVVAFDRRPVTTVETLAALVHATAPGTSVAVEARRGPERRWFTVTVGRSPEPDATPDPGRAGSARATEPRDHGAGRGDDA